MTIKPELYQHIHQLNPEHVAFNTDHIERAFKQYLPPNYEDPILVLGAGYGWELLVLRAMYPESSIIVTEEDPRYYEDNPLYTLPKTTLLPETPANLSISTIPGLVIARAPFVINQIGIDPKAGQIIPFPNEPNLQALIMIAQRLPQNGFMFISTYMSPEAYLIEARLKEAGINPKRHTHTPTDFNPPKEMIKEIPSINQSAFPEHEVLLIKNI